MLLFVINLSIILYVLTGKFTQISWRDGRDMYVGSNVEFYEYEYVRQVDV